MTRRWLGDSRRLVIDATVARAAGGKTATYPASKRCRDFLQAVVDVCHRAVMTQPIGAEWKKHGSRFFRQWRVSMEARKKIVRNVADEHLLDEPQLGAALRSNAQLEAARKDLHLINAALLTDRTIVSLDDEARQNFALVAQRCPQLQAVCWVNPGVEEHSAVPWLQDGACPEPSRLLGAPTIGDRDEP